MAAAAAFSPCSINRISDGGGGPRGARVLRAITCAGGVRRSPVGHVACLDRFTSKSWEEEEAREREETKRAEAEEEGAAAFVVLLDGAARMAWPQRRRRRKEESFGPDPLLEKINDPM